MTSSNDRRQAYLRASESTLSQASDPLADDRAGSAPPPPPPPSDAVQAEMLAEMRRMRRELEKARKFSIGRVIALFFVIVLGLLVLAALFSR